MSLTSTKFKNNSRLQQVYNYRYMKRGERNKEAVAIIQLALVNLGYFLPRSTRYDGSMDGDYGRETTQNVKSFQRNNHLYTDGIIGRNTIVKLDQLVSALAKPPISPTATKKSVILTFDDGPEPTTALNNILTILRQNNIRAEFYLLGTEVNKNRRASKSIVDQGHVVQNHSWSHINLATASEKRVYSELKHTQDIIFLATGVLPNKVRPPYGAGGWKSRPDWELSKVTKSLSLKLENWDIDTEDWKKPAGLGSRKLSNIKNQLESHKNQLNLNVLMHVKSSTARDLPNFIDKLREWGYSFANP